jgi:hypothetical protein
MNIDFTTIARGADSGYQSASQTVIDNQERWINLWQQHTSDTDHRHLFPKWILPATT